MAAVKCVLDKSTVSRWFEKFRALIACHQEQSREPLGGPGKIVEMDETVISRIKVPLGRRRTLAWMFGITERRTSESLPKTLMFLVPDRTIPTIKPLICKWVAPGTTIYTDAFPTYNCVDELGFEHGVVVHQREWVNRQNPTIHTQGQENMWGQAKHHLDAYSSRRGNVHDRVLEFLFIRETSTKAEGFAGAFFGLLGSRPDVHSRRTLWNRYKQLIKMRSSTRATRRAERLLRREKRLSNRTMKRVLKAVNSRIADDSMSQGACPSSS